jgi:hypothetical protein
MMVSLRVGLASSKIHLESQIPNPKFKVPGKKMGLRMPEAFPTPLMF